jgi:hypothetical protein
MRKLILAAAGAAAAFIGSPAFAQPMGYVGAQYVHTKVDPPGPGDISGDGGGVDGTVAFNATSSLGVTLNAAYFDTDKTDSTTAGAAHLYLKDDQYLLGGFVGVADVGSDTVWSVGGEGQWHFANWTLAGALGYANDDDADVDAWGGDAQARIFVTDNLRLQGTLGFANVDFGGPAGDDNVWTVGVGGEWQLANMPISLIADYAHSSFDDSNVDGDTFRIGARWNFGGGTLKERDHSGADLAGLSSLNTVVAF